MHSTFINLCHGRRRWTDGRSVRTHRNPGYARVSNLYLVVPPRSAPAASIYLAWQSCYLDTISCLSCPSSLYTFLPSKKTVTSQTFSGLSSSRGPLQAFLEKKLIIERKKIVRSRMYKSLGGMLATKRYSFYPNDRDFLRILHRHSNGSFKLRERWKNSIGCLI